MAAVAGVSIGLGVLQSTSQYQAQKQQAKAQQRYQTQVQEQREEQIKQNYSRAVEAYRFKTMSEQVRLEEVRKSASQQAFNTQQAFRRAQAAASARAASRGSAGQSTYLALADYLTQQGFEIGGINQQFEAERGQSGRNMQAFYQEAKDRVAGVQPYIPAPVQFPSPIAPLLTIGSTALGAYNSYILPGQMAAQRTQSAALIQPERTTGLLPGRV